MPAASAIDPQRAGVGLRAPHYLEWRERDDALQTLGFLEIHSENFFGDGGQPLAWLEWFRARYPLSAHGVGLSLGSADPLDLGHLAKWQRLIDRFAPTLVSEHLCWSGVGGRMLNDLLPLPYTPEALDHMVSRVAQVQETWRRRILIENVSSYLEFEHSTIPEWEFVATLAQRAGCGVLLDVNNIYVNSINHGFDANAYIDAIPVDAVGEIHLAGFEDAGDILIDTHGAPVCEAVWELYRYAVARFGAVPTLIEWDTDIPPLDVLLGEAARATAILAETPHVAR